jgi:hypothetical protein
MIKTILDLLKTTESKSELVMFAKGANKYPENFKEFKNYIKTR